MAGPTRHVGTGHVQNTPEYILLLYTEYGVYFVHYCIVASIVPASIARFSTLSQPPSHGLRMYVKYEVGTLQPLKAKSPVWSYRILLCT